MPILGTVCPRFKSDIGEIWHEGVGLGLPPHAKFCIKNRLRDIPLWGKFLPKIINFGDFIACKPTFLMCAQL